MKPTLADEVLALALREKIEQCQEDIIKYMDTFETDTYVIEELCSIVVRNFKTNEKENTLRDSV